MLFEDCLSEEFIQFLWMQSDITEPLSQQEPSGQHILTASTPLQVCGPREMWKHPSAAITSVTSALTGWGAEVWPLCELYRPPKPKQAS